jgi:hypothetical protein
MTTLKVTIDIFSGRENPVIELRGDDASEALRRLAPAQRLVRNSIGFPPQPTLGYRGLVIEQVAGAANDLPRTFRLAHGDLVGPRLAHRASDEAFEDFLLTDERLERLALGDRFPAVLRRDIRRFRDVRARWPWDRMIRWPTRILCRCAPLYEPAWWNVPARQPFNNCYNYATNYRTDTFAQPGRAAGAQYTALTCASVRPAAIADQLIHSPKANNKCPGEGHLVALVIWPNVDFHWYRKGRNGRWSHKPGGTAVTNVDNSGVTIADPRTADRGGYTSFCTFMTVMHGHIKLN